MNKYVAFLRAINVGGHSIIKMAELKQMFESAALEDVQTYIQSGNVIFESGERDTSLLEKRIESQVEKNTGTKVQVFVRKMQEVRSIVSQAPFTATDGETAYVAFLSQEPHKNTEQALLAYRSAADDFAIKGREVYALRRDREKSVFSTNFIEKILKMPTTTRNLTVIRKIVEKYQ